MLTFHHEIIDSTSNEVLKLHALNTPTPFAVTATQQTAGRGQRDRSWESTPGNIYLSIGAKILRKELPLFPLRSACIVTKWLQTQLVKSPTIKWPNDILIDRKKCAGILCEAAWQENASYSKITVGIGINIEHAPERTEYPAIFVKNLLREKQSIQELVISLLDFWENYPHQSSEEILLEYEKLHLPKGELWKDRKDSNSVFTNEGFSQEGHLILRNLSSGQTVELISAQHSLQWIYKS